MCVCVHRYSRDVVGHDDGLGDVSGRDGPLQDLGGPLAWPCPDGHHGALRDLHRGLGRRQGHRLTGGGGGADQPYEPTTCPTQRTAWTGGRGLGEGSAQVYIDGGNVFKGDILYHHA